MKLIEFKIENFRGYKDEVSISFHDLTAIVGKNDVGKSTILEALDLFFNNGKGVISLDNDDFNVFAVRENNKKIKFTAIFCDVPQDIVIDDTVTTALDKEFLLNADGNLEIIKEISSATATGITVKIRASHPTNEHCCSLLSKKQQDLQKIITAESIDCVDNRINSLMRQAIWKHYEGNLDLGHVELDVSTKEGDLKVIWDKIKQYLPQYSLFQSDRENNDKDGEIQEPLKIAVKQILSTPDVSNKLNDIAEYVKNRLQQVSDSTLDKIKEMNPELANSLHPRLPEIDALKWNDVFKNISITGDEDIPINKRGSGVKRLILLNFFRAEAERTLIEHNGNGIIYAIEEPETSQHLKHQQLLMDSLSRIAQNDNSQVIVTTHSPDVVKSIKDYSNIQIIYSDLNRKYIKSLTKPHLPYVSLNEIIYSAYDIAGPEFHNELYGYIQLFAINDDVKNSKEKDFENWLMGHGLSQTKQWRRLSNGVLQPSQSVTLQTYIRNYIHHPENSHNAAYTSDEIRKSIEDMINLIDSLP